MERVLRQLVKTIFIRNPKFHEHAQNSSLLLSVLRQNNTVRILANDFVKILSDIMFHPCPFLSSGLLLSPQSPIHQSSPPFMCVMPHTPHTYWFDHRLIFDDSPMVRTRNLAAPFCAVFASPILPCPCYAKYHSQHPVLDHYRSNVYSRISGFTSFHIQ
jgi:hypothetical protein